MANKKDVKVGERFGKLVVVRRIPDDSGHGIVCLFKCDCGKEKKEFLSIVRLGKRISCGCAKHGKVNWDEAQKLKDKGYRPAQIQRELGGNTDYIREKLFGKRPENELSKYTESERDKIRELSRNLMYCGMNKEAALTQAMKDVDDSKTADLGASLELEKKKVTRFVDNTPGQLQADAVEFLCIVLRGQRQRIINAIDELVKERVLRRSPVDRLYLAKAA